MFRKKNEYGTSARDRLCWAGLGMGKVTASMLYDYVACPHRVAMDIFDDPADRNEISAFMQLPWDRGFAHERAIIVELKIPSFDLSTMQADDREELTLEASL
jgi:hypothetical protein